MSSLRERTAAVYVARLRDASFLVDDAEHRGKPIMILRHGKPAAAIVPVGVAAPKRRAAKAMSPADAKALLDAFAELGDPAGDAVRDLRESRR